jgi:hypothetical protein
MRKAIGFIVAALALVASPSAAGVYYKAVTAVEGQQGVGDTTVQAWIEGEKARIEFVESGNPLTPAGAYLLTQDGGRTILLVNPEQKTYAEWDLAAMAGVAGSVMKGMGPLLKFEVSQPRVEKLADEDGGSLLGLPVRHFRYRTSYTMKVKVFGMGQESSVVSEQDIWTTRQLEDVALGVWLLKEPPSFGNEQLDALVAAETSKIDGLPLKQTTVQTTTSKRGQTTTRTHMEVKELRQGNPPAGSFQLPAGYRETQLLPTIER